MRGDADHRPGGVGYLTNDVPGCPTGGLLSGTERADILSGEKGEDEVRGLGTPKGQADELYGGSDDDVLHDGAGMDFLYGEQDDDVLYGGDGADILLVGGKGADVIRGGDGNYFLRGPLMGSGISSIAVKAGTNTLPRRSTACTQQLRERQARRYRRPSLGTPRWRGFVYRAYDAPLRGPLRPV